MATVSMQSTAGKWIMISTILASSMAFIDGTALNVVLPALQKNLHANGSDLFWVLNAYLLMLASLILIGGSMGDKIGRKKVFVWGILLFMAGSAACGFSPGINFLIVCRAIQGIGGALMIPGSLSIISSSINKEERGKAIGTWSAFTTVVTMGGPILGGALADAGLWRFIFFINIPIGIIAVLILIFRVKESADKNKDPSLDFSGAITIALGLALLTFGFLRIPLIGFNHWEIYLSLAAGIIFFIVFIFIESKSKHPMMPLKLFSSRTFSGVNLLTFFLYAGLGAGMLFLSLNMIQAQGYTQLQSGLTFLPFTILMMSIARFAGRLADKYGARKLLIAGPAVAGIGLLMLSFVKQTNGAGDYWTTFFPGILMFGLGMSFTVAPLTATVMSAADEHLSGTASGINNAMTRISNVFANAIFGALAVLFFSNALQKDLQKTSFSIDTKQSITAQAINLGDAKPPANIDSNKKPEVEKLYRQGFISSYGKIMQLASGLAFTGALMSLLFIKDKETS